MRNMRAVYTVRSVRERRRVPVGSGRATASVAASEIVGQRAAAAERQLTLEYVPDEYHH
jgi:hypothetical protein